LTKPGKDQDAALTRIQGDLLELKAKADRQQHNRRNLLAEAMILSRNAVAINTLEGRTLLNLLTRFIENEIDGETHTPPLSTHHA